MADKYVSVNFEFNVVYWPKLFTSALFFFTRRGDEDPENTMYILIGMLYNQFLPIGSKGSFVKFLDYFSEFHIS